MRFLDGKMRKLILSVLFLAVVILLIYLLAAGELGIPKFKLEDDARTKENYFCENDLNEDMAAFLFYDEEGKDIDVRIYENKKGISFGYFFRYGGSCYGAETGIAEIDLSDSTGSRAFLSMNTLHVVQAEFGNGTRIELEGNKPFVLVVKKEILVEFFDAEGNRVEPTAGEPN